MNTSYNVVEALSADGGQIAVPVPWEFELSEVFIVAEHSSGTTKIFENLGALTIDGDGNLVVPALLGGEPFKVWISRRTQIRHDYDSGGDTIDDKTIDAELKELTRKTEENAVESSRSIKFPEAGKNTMYPSAENRANEIAGFDEEGNPTVGEGCERVRDFYAKHAEAMAAKNAAEASANAARESDVNAKSSADIATVASVSAGNAATAASQSAQNAANSATLAVDAATSANSAKDVAEAARAEALSAQGVAVDAKNEALASAESAKSSELNAAEAEWNAMQYKVVAQMSAERCEELAVGMSRVYKYRGSVSTIDALPSSGNEVGDVWNVASSGRNYAWDGSAWDSLAGDVEFAAADDLVAEAARAETAEQNIRNNYAKYHERNSGEQAGDRHGKVLLATSNGDDGGFYAAGSRASTPAWTQWLTRYQWDKIRAYGNTNGVFEEYVWTPGSDGTGSQNQVMRRKDLEPYLKGTWNEALFGYVYSDAVFDAISFRNGFYGFNYDFRYDLPRKTGTLALVEDIGSAISNDKQNPNVVIGSGAKNTNEGGDGNIAIGSGSESNGSGSGAASTAVGARAKATGNCSVALGRDARAENCLTVAVGAGAAAEQQNAVAIGANVNVPLAYLALIGTGNITDGVPLCIGVINDENPGFVFVETLNGTVSGVRISKENFMSMLKQFGGEDWTATANNDSQ